MKTAKFLEAVLFNIIIGFVLATIFGFSPVLGAVVVNAGGVAMAAVKAQNKTALFEGLAKEVWIPLVLQNPYPKASFLQAATNLSSLVDNDKINFAEAGVDPQVFVDNAVYPIPVVDVSDFPQDVSLKTYDTANSVVRDAVAIELAYDQRGLYVTKHQKALAKKIGMDAAYMYAPIQADATKNNTVLTLAANDSFIDGIIDLQTAYNNADTDEDRNLVLCPKHQAKIAKEDKLLYKSLMAEPGSMYCGFRIWTYSKNPFYITATGVKAAYGAAFDPATHSASSFAFVGSEVMVADGTIKLFQRLNDPEARGDVFGFQKRALATTLRGCFGGAILQ